MNKIYRFFLSSLIIFLLATLIIAPHTAWAAASYDTVYLPESMTVSGLYFKNAGTITIDGNINGETYLIGGQIIVNGNVNGDLLATGGTVAINGNVSDNVRIAGGTVSISGNVGKNVLVLAGQTEIEKAARINGNLTIASGNAQVLGTIAGQTQIAAGNLFFNGKSAGNATLWASNLKIEKQANFAQDLTYTTEKAIETIKQNVSGRADFIKTEVVPPMISLNNKSIQTLKPFAFWASFFNYLIFGFLLTFIFPKQFGNVSRFLKEKPLASIIAGFIYYAICPIIVLILIVTLIGIPLAIIFAILTVILVFISRIVIGLYVGSQILKDEENKFLPLLLGLSLIQLLTLIPFLGFFVKILVVLLGTGGILLSKMGKYAK